MQAIFDVLNFIAGLFNDFFSGQLLKDFSGYLIQKLTVWYLEAKIEAIQFAWGIAQNILTDLSLSQRITDTLTALPQDVRNVMNFLRVPEAITNLLTAYVTRFVLRFMPG